MYCDRIPLSNSSRKGALPVLLFVNELPKSLRFKHPILCSIYVGELSNISEKSLLGYTSNILTQLENGLEYYSANFQQTKLKSCYLLAVVVDSPQRANLRNVKQFNSYHGCDWCLVQAKQYKMVRSMVYLLQETNLNLRTHDQMKEIASKKESDKNY